MLHVGRYFAPVEGPTWKELSSLLSPVPYSSPLFSLPVSLEAESRLSKYLEHVGIHVHNMEAHKYDGCKPC